MKKLFVIVCAMFFLMALVVAQDMEKNQLCGSINSTLEILKEIDKAKITYGEDSIVYKKAEEKLNEKKSRSNFVVWYYNYLKMIENDPRLPDEEKKDWKKLLLKEANRIYEEKHSSKKWLEQARKDKVAEKFLEYHLMTDRFLNLILRVYEKYDEDVEATEEFLNDALTDPDPIGYILRDLRENIKIVRERIYKMKKGETLSGVFGKKWKKIAEYNGIEDLTKIPIGLKIKIPEQTIDIPKYIDKTIQFCILAADKLVMATREKIIIAEVTLAVLRVESREGRRIGTGIYHSDMKPSEKEEFLSLCLRLGIDPETTPVSKKPYYGWGGAMGPEQFMPKTWAACEPDVCLMANQKFVSPYNLKHAIFATASKLVASGVASSGSDTEKRAVMRYFAGKNYDKPGYQFYWRRIKEELEKIRANQEIKKMFKD